MKVCHTIYILCAAPETLVGLEYKDDYLVPRSSSVVVKRVPLIRGTRSRFGRYLAGAGPRPAAPTALTQHNKAPAPAALWTRGTGAFSKRFDGKEDPKLSTSIATVSILVFGIIDNTTISLPHLAH
jgi:hypothetical protein